MSVLLTTADAERVMESLDAAIHNFLSDYAKRYALSVVILDPASPNEPVVLYAQTFGDPAEWERDYREIAMGKAVVCLRNKCDSETVRAERPFCYRAGDPPYMGGVYVQGLVVACSGVEGYFDQMFARWIAAACRAWATHRLQTEVVTNDLDAIPG